VGQGEVVGSPTGYMVAARLGYERTMVSTGWATFHPNCMDRLRKLYCHLVVGFWQGRLLGL